MALVCAGALAVLPLAAGPAAAQSAEDLCAEAPEELDPIFGPICEQFPEEEEPDPDAPDEGEDEEGPTGTPLDELLGQLDPEQLEELTALCDEAPEELGPISDPLCEALAGGEEEPEPDEDPEPTPDEEDADPSPSPDTGADTTDADTSGDLPMTGGAAGLVGLTLLGAGAALRRFNRQG